MQSAEWAAPIVPVVKSDGSVHICGDYQMTVNQVSRLDSYPLPRVDELFATLAGRKNLFEAGSPTCIFAATTGDELQTSTQQSTPIEVCSSTTDYPLVCHLHQGYSRKQLIWLGQGNPSCIAAYMDDILLTGETQEQHLQNLTAVLERLVSASLASQTHFRKRGKGLVNCVYKPCPTGMQLAGWRNQISNNALLNYLLQSKHAPWKLFSKCFYGCCSSGKDVLALFRCFQDCYYYSNNDVMCHVTKYCNMIGPHCTVRRDKACIRSSPDPSLSCGSGSGLRD